MREQDAHQATCCFHTNNRATVVSRRMSTKKDRHRRGRAGGLDYDSSIFISPPPRLKGPLCSQCSETKEEDMPGRERGSKGGRGGVGEAPWTSARDALPPCNSGLLTHRILQAQQTLPQGLAAASPTPLHTPASVQTHNRRSRSHGTGKRRAVLLLPCARS